MLFTDSLLFLSTLKLLFWPELRLRNLATRSERFLLSAETKAIWLWPGLPPDSFLQVKWLLLEMGGEDRSRRSVGRSQRNQAQDFAFTIGPVKVKRARCSSVMTGQ